MEARNSTAGNGDEHKAPNGSAFGVHIVEVGPDLGNVVLGMSKDTNGNAHSHDDQADTENRVNLTDDLINGQESGDEVIDQNQNQPEQRLRKHAACTGVLAQGHDQACGANGEHSTNHNQQHNAEHTHNILHHTAKVDAGDLRDGSAVVTLAHHAGKEVMHSTGKNGAESDPQEYHRSPQSTLQCAENGAKAGNIQQLYQKQLPLRHHHIVNAIVDFNGRGFTVVRAKCFFNHFTVCKVANDQNCQTQEKTEHIQIPPSLSLRMLKKNKLPQSGGMRQHEQISHPFP